uniref:Uncharacterized protein n=1 Tax=Bos indicus x Bos taurus TaxID=30522 RepID=A0A4W2EJK1_BOBOX
MTDISNRDTTWKELQNRSYTRWPARQPGGIGPLQQMVTCGAGAVILCLQSQRPLVRSDLMPPPPDSEASPTPKCPPLAHPQGNKCLLDSSGVLEPLCGRPLCATCFPDPTRSTVTEDGLVKMVRHEGTGTLWHGLPAIFVDDCRPLPPTSPPTTLLKAFLCGGAPTSSSAHPWWLVRGPAWAP